MSKVEESCNGMGPTRTSFSFGHIAAIMPRTTATASASSTHTVQMQNGKWIRTKWRFTDFYRLTCVLTIVVPLSPPPNVKCYSVINFCVGIFILLKRYKRKYITIVIEHSWKTMGTKKPSEQIHRGCPSPLPPFHLQLENEINRTCFFFLFLSLHFCHNFHMVWFYEYTTLYYTYFFLSVLFCF